MKDRLNSIYENNTIEDVSKMGNSLIMTFSNNKTLAYSILTGKVLDLTNTMNISKSGEKSFAGCYADIDSDGTVDGIIFADLLTGSIKETEQLSDSYGEYSIPKKSAESLKDYYVSKEKHDSIYGKKDVISPKSSGNDRFYILSLYDYEVADNTMFTFYNRANKNLGNWKTMTSYDFGKGRENTEKIINSWNKNFFGDKDEQDLWNYIQKEVSDGWFIPSKGELAAFANELDITGSNRNDYGFKSAYFTSSQSNTIQKYVWNLYFTANSVGMANDNCTRTWNVRLATTF